jgi:hypothetical protein
VPEGSRRATTAVDPGFFNAAICHDMMARYELFPKWFKSKQNMEKYGFLSSGFLGHTERATSALPKFGLADSLAVMH